MCAIDEIDADLVETGLVEGVDGDLCLSGGMFSAEEFEGVVVEGLYAQGNASKSEGFPGFCACGRDVFGVCLEGEFARSGESLGGGDEIEEQGDVVVVEEGRGSAAEVEGVEGIL